MKPTEQWALIDARNELLKQFGGIVNQCQADAIAEIFFRACPWHPKWERVGDYMLIIPSSTIEISHGPEDEFGYSTEMFWYRGNSYKSLAEAQQAVEEDAMRRVKG